jgi:hypothetical protein
MKRSEAEQLLNTYMQALDHAGQAAHLAFGPSSPQQREEAMYAIRESHNARERVIEALMQVEHAEAY